MEEQAKSGKKLLIFIAAVTIFVSLGGLAVYLMHIGTYMIPIKLIQPISICVMWYFVFKGFNWARIVTMVLSGLTILSAIISIVSSLNDLTIVIASLAYIFAYLSAFILLLIESRKKA